MSDKVQPIKKDSREYDLKLTATQIRFINEALDKVNVGRAGAETLVDLDRVFSELMKRAGNES